jgi:hypothetical protein
VGDLKKFLKGEFKAGDILKIIWGRELVNIDQDQQLIKNIIRDLKNRTNGAFVETNTLVATFNFIGGAP